jgi:hypothetical protein
VHKELWNKKAACKILVKLTVIPRFFAQLLSAYYFGFVIFWQKDFGTKAAHKMLVKLTPGHIKPLSLSQTIAQQQIDSVNATLVIVVYLF